MTETLQSQQVVQRALGRGRIATYASGALNPLYRQREFHARAVRTSPGDHATVIGYALDDMQLAAFSAYRLARTLGRTRPAHIARGSLDLLRIANLGHPHLTRVFHPAYTSHDSDWQGIRLIDPQYLALEIDPDRVAFTAEVSDHIDASIVPEAGCPATEASRQLAYKDYVDAVFAPQLNQEIDQVRQQR